MHIQNRQNSYERKYFDTSKPSALQEDRCFLITSFLYTNHYRLKTDKQ